jgi:hypothetical protein
MDYGLNRALDAYYNDRAWFHGLQKRVMEQVRVVQCSGGQAGGQACGWAGRQAGGRAVGGQATSVLAGACTLQVGVPAGKCCMHAGRLLHALIALMPCSLDRLPGCRTGRGTSQQSITSSCTMPPWSSDERCRQGCDVSVLCTG